MAEVLGAFSLTLAPQGDSTYMSNVGILGKLLASYRPRLLTADEFTKR